MSFVTVISNGGEHDDASYICGFEMGRLDVRLSIGSVKPFEEVVHSANIKQADLIAMRHGYVMTVYREDELWTNVRFTKIQ